MKTFAFTDTVVITVMSGFPGGEEGEFASHMQVALSEWYDGASVTERLPAGSTATAAGHEDYIE